MGHDHNHGHHDHHDHDESGNIGVAFFLNLSFAVIEVAGGLLTNSVAILSDALHDLHLWSLDGEHTILTVHLVLDGPVTPEMNYRIKRETSGAMEKLGIEHCTLELEGANESCARCCP